MKEQREIRYLNNGRVEVEGGIRSSASVKTLYACPKEGYDFTRFIVDGIEHIENPLTLQYSKPEQKNVTVYFKKISTYSLIAKVNNLNYGSVSIEGSETDSTKIATAIANENYVFDHWEGDASGNENPIEISFSGSERSKTITAVFVENNSFTVITKTTGIIKKRVIGTLKNTDVRGSDSTTEDYSILDVVVGNAVDSIADRCFYKINLNAVNFKSKINNIGVGTFEESGISSFSFQNYGYDIVPSKTFYQTQIQKIENINASITSIEDYSFARCNKLSDVSFISQMNSLQYIRDYAFYEDSNISSVSFNVNLKEISHCSFYNCNSLCDIYFDQFDGNLPTIYSDTFNPHEDGSNRKFHFKNEDMSLYASTLDGYKNFVDEFDPQPRTTQTLIDISVDKNINFYIKAEDPNDDYIYWGDDKYSKITTKTISYNHAYEEKNNYSISIDNCIENISQKFIEKNRSSIVSIKNIGGNVYSIEQMAFRHCINLSSIMIPSTTHEIGYKLCDGCHKLTLDNVDIINGSKIQPSFILTKNKQFINLLNKTNDDLTELIIPDGTLSILEYVVYSGLNAIYSIKIPSSVTYIHPDFIGNKHHIQQFNIDNNDKYETTSDKKQIVDKINNQIFSSLTNLETNSGATSIGKNAYRSMLSETITIDSSIVDMDNSSIFFDCYNLTCLDLSKTEMSDEYVKTTCINNKWFKSCVESEDETEDETEDEETITYKEITIKTKTSTLTCTVGSDDFHGFEDQTGTYSIMMCNEDSLTGISVDIERLSSMFVENEISHEKNINILLNKDATTANFNTKLRELYANEKCKNLIIMYSGHGGSDSNGCYMYLYNGQKYYSDTLWTNIKNYAGSRTDKVKTTIVMNACHTGGFLPTSFSSTSYDSSNNTTNVDGWCESAERFFERTNNNMLKVSSFNQPILVWAACKANEVTWCVTEKDVEQGTYFKDNTSFYEAVGNIGNTLMISLVENYDSDSSYEQLWNDMTYSSLSYDEELSSYTHSWYEDNACQMNQAVIEFMTQYESEWEESGSKLSLKEYAYDKYVKAGKDKTRWPGPTPQKKSINGFNENTKAFS